MIATCHRTGRVIPEPTVAGTECGLQATQFRYTYEHVRAVSMRVAIGILIFGMPDRDWFGVAKHPVRWSV